MEEFEESGSRSISRSKPDVPMELQQKIQETEIHVKDYVQIKEHKSRDHLLQNHPLH